MNRFLLLLLLLLLFFCSARVLNADYQASTCMTDDNDVKMGSSDEGDDDDVPTTCERIANATAPESSSGSLFSRWSLSSARGEGAMKNQDRRGQEEDSELVAETDESVTLADDYYEQFGVDQVIDSHRRVQVEKALHDMTVYMYEMRNNPNTTAHDHEVLDHCTNQHENCAFWMVLGECEKNPAYMKIHCAPVCRTCDQLDVAKRCPIDPTMQDTWSRPGDVNKFFSNVANNFPQYHPQVLSRPAMTVATTPAGASLPAPTANVDDGAPTAPMEGPWLIVLDDFLSDEEADRLIQLGQEQGYERSSDVGKMNYDGTFEQNVNSGRTSTNSWCQDACYNDTIARNVIDRIAQVTGIPETNSEYLQMLRYTPNQYYRTHHDLIEHQKDRQEGVRIATFYMYLNDVEEGGETSFPRINLSVTPKKGRAVLWPSVLDEFPNQRDDRTHHEARPVIRGVKYGANAWIHQRDYKTPHATGCT